MLALKTTRWSVCTCAFEQMYYLNSTQVYRERARTKLALQLTRWKVCKCRAHRAETMTRILFRVKWEWPSLLHTSPHTNRHCIRAQTDETEYTRKQTCFTLPEFTTTTGQDTRAHAHGHLRVFAYRYVSPCALPRMKSP